jgi:hypothetical protein
MEAIMKKRLLTILSICGICFIAGCKNDSNAISSSSQSTKSSELVSKTAQTSSSTNPEESKKIVVQKKKDISYVANFAKKMSKKTFASFFGNNPSTKILRVGKDEFFTENGSAHWHSSTENPDQKREYYEKKYNIKTDPRSFTLSELETALK